MTQSQAIPFILASQSPQRKKILRRLKIPFKIIPSTIRETDPDKIHHFNAKKLVTDLAIKKAKAVAKKFKNRPCIILGADTLVVCNKKILGKPKSEEHARKMLTLLSGRAQQVLTGVCLIKNPEGTLKKGCSVTTLKFKKLDDKTIRHLAKKNRDKSGSYAIQKMKDQNVRIIKGDLDNVIGLPLALVKKLISFYGLNIL